MVFVSDSVSTETDSESRNRSRSRLGRILSLGLVSELQTLVSSVSGPNPWTLCRNGKRLVCCSGCLEEVAPDDEALSFSWLRPVWLLGAITSRSL